MKYLICGTIIFIVAAAIFSFSVKGCIPKVEQFHTISYKQHQYIVYNGMDYDSGLQHDPDCPCGWSK